MLNAIGIAGSQASGSMEYLADGAWTKRFHPGWSAHNGIIAARLAEQGFRGPSAMLERASGFLKAYSDQADPIKITDFTPGSGRHGPRSKHPRAGFIAQESCSPREIPKIH